jgi:hypothetical protein
MNKHSRIALVTFALTCAFLLTACPKRTSIADLKRNPARYDDKEVAVAGRVVDAYGLLGRGVYEVDDGTGRLWVVTERGLPERGARVGAKGTLLNGFNFAGRNFGTVLREDDRRQRR